MKLNALINEEKHEVEVRREGSRLFASVDGREYELEVSEPESNVYLFKLNGKTIEAFVQPAENLSGRFQVRIGNHNLDIALVDPKRLRGSSSSGTDDHGTVEIRSAMPGKVVRIIASLGSAIEAGQGVLVVEAMKMQNELKSPKSGTVKDVRVEEGSTVNTGDILAVIE